MKRLFSLLVSFLFVATTMFPLAATAEGPNLIANASFESSTNGTQPDGWKSDAWGTNTRTFSYPNVGHTGSKSAKVEITKYTSGDAKWFFSPVVVKPSTSYNLSDWYQSNTSSNIDVVVKTTNNKTKYLWQGNQTASATWNRANYTFKTPANAATVTVFHYIEKVGQLTIDDVSLNEVGTVVTPPPTAPAVSVTAPANNAQVSGATVVTADASDAASIKSVQFKLDNVNLGSADTTSPYSINWDTLQATNGTHTLTAVAINASNLTTTSDPITVTVLNEVIPTPPTVTLTAPASGSTVSGSTTVSASAGDAKGIANVQFKLDGVNFGVADTAPPFTTPWDTLASSNGTHTLSAVATNTSGLSTSSSAVNVTVNNVVTPPPPTADNLVPNPSVESSVSNQPTNWINGSWGTNAHTLSYEPTGYKSNHSLKAQITSYTNGDVKWLFQPVAVSSGTYQYSNYYQSNVATELDAMVTMNDGSVQWLYLTTAAPSLGVWKKVTTQVSVPVGAKTLSIFQALTGVGYLQTDEFSLTSYAPAQLNRGIVSLTFDDGWRSIYTNGLPALKKYSLPSTQYLLTDTIDYPDYMTVAMMQAFKDQGSEIASHTVDHEHLTQLSAAALTAELTSSQNTLRGWFGITAAKNFATPYGEYNQSVVNEIKKYYRSHRSTDVGFNSKDNFDLYNIKVQNIINTTTPAQVQAWVNQAMLEKTWVVLVYHEVSTSAADQTYAVTPANLDSELSGIKQSGISVQTVDSALNEILAQL